MNPPQGLKATAKAISNDRDAEGELQSLEEILNSAESKESPETKDSEKRAQSPAHRPLTRSQTGRVSKRRRPDESPPPETRQKVARAPRKIKTNFDQADEPSTMASKGDTVVTSAPRQISASKPSGTPAPSEDAAAQTPIEEHITLRANLPIPVPNLTKKSRGRRVPTKLPDDAGGSTADPKDGSRIYVCKVESCGKCFHRGEHLKRHIRSIHTHEKPFKCTYPSCNKHFNRHDNLLQHLKVHRDLATSETSAADDSGSPIELQRNSPSPALADRPPPQLQPYYPATYDSPVKRARLSVAYQVQSSSRTYDAPYARISEPVGFATNMAVSSLRTELPQSPPTSRA